MHKNICYSLATAMLTDILTKIAEALGRRRGAFWPPLRLAHALTLPQPIAPPNNTAGLLGKLVCDTYM
jgi:hypothetical protein